MDEIRAKHIAASPVMANVTFLETKVYIESVNESKGTANVHILNQPNSKQEVPLISLIEH
jgi:small acid-soluble spore protein H (minor)